MIKSNNSIINQVNNKNNIINQVKPAEHLSQSYSFISTRDILDFVLKDGFYIKSVEKQRCKYIENEGYQKHLVTLEHSSLNKPRTLLNVGDIIPQVLLWNSYNGSCSLNFAVSFFRCFCSNQCVTLHSEVSNIKLKHINLTLDDVKSAIDTSIKNIPLLTTKISSWSGINLSKQQQIDFANNAINIRWANTDNKPFSHEILKPRRSIDTKTDLWTIYNRIQEALIKGGSFLPITKQSSRPIKAIDSRISINQSLWKLAEEVIN